MPPSHPRTILDALLEQSTEIRTPCGEGDMVWRAWGTVDADRASPGGNVQPPVVLLHGGFGAWNHWVRNIPALTQHARVIAADLPGCGESADPPAPYDADSLAALISDALDIVVPDGAPFDLMSFSFGGVLSGRIAHAQERKHGPDRLRRLTIVGTPILGLARSGPATELVAVPADATPDEAAAIYRGNLEKLMVHAPAAVDDLAMTLHIENMARARLRSRGIARRNVPGESLRGLSCRLAFVMGEHDTTLGHPFDEVRACIAEAQPGAPLHVIAGAGHWVQYEAADAFNALLPELLAG